MREIIPFNRMERRMPEGGRIRIGKKAGNRPTSIGTFRFTSQDHDAITQIAEHYGGTVQEWTGGHGMQWEVETDASEVRIVLPPEPLTQHYELWSGGGCQRRCDGEKAEVPGHDEMVTTDCICVQQEEMACSPKTRLNVILPDVKFGGVWRLETSSWNAAKELPGMVQTIQQLQDSGLTRGLLALEKRQSKSGGRTRNYVVPTLRLNDSVDRIVQGMAQVNRLAGPQSQPVLDAPSGGVEDASTVDSPPTVEASTPPIPREAPPSEDTLEGEASTSDGGGKNKRRAFAMFRELGWDYESQVKPALQAVYDGKSISSMTDEEIGKFCAAIKDDEARARFEEHMPYIVEDAEVVS